MIALLDPALFLRPGNAGEPLSPIVEDELEKQLVGVLAACKAAEARLANIDGYWDELWSDIIGPLERRSRKLDTKKRFQELRKAGVPFLGLPAAAPRTRVWGFRQMFGGLPGVSPGWDDRLATAAARLLASQRELLLLTRLVEGRNLNTRSGKTHSVIAEITRWRVSVHLPGTQRSVHIPCVRSEQQITREWTTRYDERLPTDRDSVRYPFCLPPGDTWALRNIAPVRTVAAVPAWLDQNGKGWARPNIPGGRGYHWDVFFTDQTTIGRVGVDQLNIVELGAPASEGNPGELHHVPSKKQGTVNDVGWSCP